jgi:UDP-N-acetylmuramate dehydrogenase
MVEVLSDIRLSDKTFYGIGGGADSFVEVDRPEDLSEIWEETIHKKIPKIILGKGSNMVFSDKGFRGRVFYPSFDKITVLHPADQETGKKADLIISAEAGRNFQDFLAETNRLGFSDLCPLSGIPGNVGGFIRGNAGAMGVETGDFVVAVEYLDANGQLQKISGEKCAFAYRESLFKKNPDFFIVRGIFRLGQQSDPVAAKQKTDQILSDRWQKYPPGRSGGCVFKNPVGGFSGEILESLGAKGDQIGGIAIAEEHANFFVNRSGGTQQDLLQLIKKWRDRVWEARGVRLELEVCLVDEWGKVLR